MTRGNERDEPVRETVEGLYDAFAPALYRYAWSLLGEGPGAADAVHDGLVAARTLTGRPADPGERAPWLYALVRAAARRRGFAPVCPYARLATVPAEEPVARMFSRLPASHRELVELHLRHALPASAIARVLGLDPDLCAGLARSAVRRAADALAEARDPKRAARARVRVPADEGPPSPAAWRARTEEVSTALALLRPPGPPPGLRDRVAATCSDPALDGERRRIAREMHPLTSQGYPLHRSRAAEDAAGAGAGSGPGGGAGAEARAPRPARVLPGDRLTTADHPVHEEHRAPQPAPGGVAEDGEQAAPRRSRRALPVLAGLATAALAVALWGWAGTVEDPRTVIGAGPDDPPPPGSALTGVESASTAADTRPEAGPTEPAPTAPAGPAPSGTGQERSGQDGAADEGPGDPDTPPAAPHEPAEPPQDGAPGEEAPPQAPSPDPGDDDASGEDPDDGGSGRGGGLLGGLLGLLLGGG